MLLLCSLLETRLAQLPLFPSVHGVGPLEWAGFEESGWFAFAQLVLDSLESFSLGSCYLIRTGEAIVGNIFFFLESPTTSYVCPY